MSLIVLKLFGQILYNGQSFRCAFKEESPTSLNHQSRQSSAKASGREVALVRKRNTELEKIGLAEERTLECLVTLTRYIQSLSEFWFAVQVA